MIKHLLASLSAVFALSFAPAYADKAKEPNAEKLTFTNKLEQDKKVWTPSAPHVKAGKVEITLTNTLKDPHGFTLVTHSTDSKSKPATLVETIVLNGNETKTVTVDLKEGSYNFKCPMHPAHVGGSIVVIK